MSTELTLGIDLGDSSCRMSWFDPVSGRVSLIPAGTDGPDMPSVVAWNGQGLVAGDEALRAWEADPKTGLIYRLARSALGGPSRFALGEGELDPSGVAKVLLQELKRRAEAQLGRTFNRAALAYPSSYDVIAQDALRGAAREAGFAEVELVPEPDAALIGSTQAGASLGESVLVCDIGGASSTVSVLTRAANGSFFPAITSRMMATGCDAIDLALYAHIDAERRKLGGSGLGPGGEVDPRMLRRCGRLREELSRTDRAVFRDDQAGGGEVAVDRAWLDAVVTSKLDEVRRAVAEAARAAEVATRPVDSALLVGFGASLPSAARLLAPASNRPPVVPDNPRVVVAFGAAWLGSGHQARPEESAFNPYDTPEFREFLSEYHQNAKERRLVILLAGRTGVGKSSTVNSLMGRVVAKVNHHEPGTFDVTPYDTEVEGIPFRIVDTPGLCDAPTGTGDNDQHYIRKMRDVVGRIDSLWFVSELFQRRPPSTDELRAIRILSQAFEQKAEVWKTAVIVFTSANSIPKERFEEAVRIKADQLRQAIAAHAGPVVASRIPAAAIENESDTTPDGKEWRGELYTQVCLTVSREGFASWMFATQELFEPKSESSDRRPRSERDEDYLDAARSRGASRGENGSSRFKLNEPQETAIRERARQEVVTSYYESRGAEIGGRIGGSVGSFLGGSGSTAERAFSDIGSGIGRAVGKFCDWVSKW